MVRQNAVTSVIDALATYRLTRLITDDFILDPVRTRFLERYPPETTKVGYWATCPWCASISVAAGVVTARMVAPKAWAPVASLLAYSAVTGNIAGREP